MTLAAAQALGVVGLGRDVAELPAQRVPLVHAAHARADPEHAAAVLGQREDVVVGEARGIARVLAVVGEGAALGIEEVEAAAGADPEAAARVLEERAHVVVGQAVGDRGVVAEALEAAASRGRAG